MDHNAIKVQLFALYDGELGEAARQAVEAHLSECNECHTVIAQWRQAAGMLFRATEVPASEVFVQRVMRSLPGHPEPFRLPHWFLEGSRLISAAALAAILLVLVQGPLQQPVSVETLLMSDRQEASTEEQLFSAERLSSDDVLGLIIEDAS